MQKINHIIAREYRTRVQKRSFIILSLLGPLFFGLLMVGPTLLFSLSGEDKKMAVLDNENFLNKEVQKIDNLQLDYAPLQLEAAKESLREGKYDVVLHIPQEKNLEKEGITLYHEKSISTFTKKAIQREVENRLEEKRLREAGIEAETIAQIQAKLPVRAISVKEEGGEQEFNSELATVVAYIFMMAMYFFVFYFGTQVMRGVQEEKSSRIVEVIISSAKPFELMLGKIIGLAGVALTQFGLWAILSFAITLAVPALLGLDAGNVDMTAMASPEAAEMAVESGMPTGSDVQMYMKVTSGLEALNWQVLLIFMVGFFLLGYLQYAGLFAAIGSAMGFDTNSQQFMLPVTAPLLIGLFIAIFGMKEPDHPVVFWGSFFPLTSPMVMMVRMTFGAPLWQAGLSLALLVGGTFGTTWFAARIYRVGILMYGKKITFKEVIKWVRYAD